MVAAVESTPAIGANATSYNFGGYGSLDDFLAATSSLDLKLFEAKDAALVDGRPVAATQKESREGKRGLLFWVAESLSRRPVDYFEFGVMSCKSFNRVLAWTPSPDARFYGFDTFEGLPEPWVRQFGDGSVRVSRTAGDLKAAHPPAVYDSRATLFKGLFQETLPEALQTAFPSGRQADRPLFINIDCDIYSGALYVLTSMHTLLRSGDLVYFDEFYDVMNEFSAFNDYIRAYGTKTWFTPVARAYDGVLFRIELPPQPDVMVVDRRSTSYLARMQEYLRSRMALRKRRNPGFDQPGSASGPG